MTPTGFRQPGQAWRHAACTPSPDKNRKPPIIHGTIHYRERQKIEIVFHAVGDAVEDQRAGRGAGLAPGILGLVGGVERQFYVGGRGPRHRAELLAGDRRRQSGVT